MNVKNISFTVILLVFINALCANGVYGLTHYTSLNEEGNGGTGGAAVQQGIMQDVDLLDDDWRLQFQPTSIFETYTFSGDQAGGIEANYGNEYFDMIYANGSIIKVERVDADASTITGSVSATNTNPRIDFGSDMQDSAPKPYTFSGAGFRNETSGGASSSRNAILFTFLGTPIDGFGFRLGDTESRSDGEGVEGAIEYFDSAGVLIGTGVIGPAAGVDQSLCGGSNAGNSPSACGNETTRYVGFKKSLPSEDIKWMRVIVGDDDDPGDAGTTDGGTEHLSFIGPTIVEEIFVPDLGLVKTGSVAVMSGDEIGYSLVVTNHGPGAASGVVIEETYPAGFTFGNASPAPTSGNTLWEVGPLLSGANYTITITGSLAGLTGDYVNTARVSAESEDGPVSNTGTHTTSIVCDVDFGAECTGTANVCGGTNTGTVQCDGTCDAIDAVDPIGLGLPCNAGLGVCNATGVTICDATGFGVTCNAIAGIPSTSDVCDGLDNDCDGEIDEDFTAAPTSCGIGECGSTGMTSCIAGEIVDSCEALAPSANDAVCDGLDNDCDGQVDEDFVEIATSCGVGACQAAGNLACVDGVAVDSCLEGAAGVDAICNGIDDDCDGLIDEDYVVIDTSCGIGQCGATGVTSCEAGVVLDSCEALAPSANDAVCDGLDNDCDGEVDEDYIAETTSCGVGECGAGGVTSCEAGSVIDSCLELSPSEELCDGLDNNCDGRIDEEDICVEPEPEPELQPEPEPEPQRTDLAISIECTPEIAQSGELMSCNVIYENLGDGDALDTDIVIDFPDTIKISELPNIPGVICEFGSINCGGDGYTLGAGESVSFSFDALVTGSSDEVFDINATIATTTLETNYANNEDEDSIQLFERRGRGGSATSNYCGDGNQVAGEACDDGNNISGDGCSNNCALETQRSDSVDKEAIIDEEIIELFDDEDIVIMTQEDLKIIETIVEIQQTVQSEDAVHSSTSTPTIEPFALPLVLPNTGALL